MIARRPRLRSDTDTQRVFEPRIRQHIEQLSTGQTDTHLAAFRDLLRRSPFYRESLAAAGLGPSDLQSVADLFAFPVLTRSVLQRRWEDVAVLSDADEEWAVVQSSGSSGDPVSVLRNRYELVLMWGVLRFWLQHLQIDIPHRPTVVLLCSLPGGLEYDAELPLFMDGHLYRISIVAAGAADRLAALQPCVLFTDPAGLHWIRQHRIELNVRLYLSSAQYLPPDWRHDFAAPIINYYASTETGPLAWECLTEPGCFHVLTPDVWLESVGGRLLVTRLRPGPWPLLRYDIGDDGQVAFEACRCGRCGWTLRDFGGRRACWWTRPDGQRVDAWQLAWLFKQQGLASFHMAQVGVQDFDLWLCGTSDADLVARLERALVLLGWQVPHIRMGPPGTKADKPEPFA